MGWMMVKGHETLSRRDKHPELTVSKRRSMTNRNGFESISGKNEAGRYASFPRK
jgi:hypothetical protein